MRKFMLVVSCVLGVTAVAAQNYVTFREDLATKIFTDSRNAIGGDGAITRLQSMVLKGSAVLAPEDGGPIHRDIEIRIMLPDRIVRIEKAPEFERRLGFSGTKVIAGIMMNGQLENPPANLHATLLRSERQKLARLLLGVCSAVTPVQWLTLAASRGVGKMSNPLDGPTGVISEDSERFRRTLEVTGDPAFFARVSYNGANLPVSIEYPPTKGTTAVAEFSDRRRVGDLLLPYRITTKIKDRVVEDLRFTEILVNPPLTLEDFVR